MATTSSKSSGRRGFRLGVIGWLSLCGFVSVMGVIALQFQQSTRAQQPREVPAPTSAQLQRGQQVYATNCAACHGDKGDGKGPMARFLYPRPRNFGEAKFRIVTTMNGKPSDDDLLLVINQGMPGSAMFPYGHLPDADKQALLAYLRELTKASFVEYAKQQAEAMEETVDLDELKQAAITQLKPGEPLTLPKDLPATSNDSVARGAKLYTQSCAACHGATGKGDGVQAQKNDDGMQTRPRDLTRGIFKGSRDPKQLYARIMLGMPGSPMPGSMQTIKPADAGDLMNYLLSLSTPASTALVEHKRTRLLAERAKGPMPNDGLAAGWQQVPAQRILVSPLWWRDHDDPELTVAALHDGTTLALRLTWKDATKSSEILRPEDFLDMAAVQFCNVQPEPFLGMGADKGQVDLWLWRAGTAARPGATPGPLDEYPFDNPIYRELVKGKGKPPDFLTARGAGNPNLTDRTASYLAAKGAGSTTFLPPASQLVVAQADWKDGRWTVVLRRPLQIPQGGLSFAAGKNYSIAFGLWEGSVRDRNGQKLVSIWHDLKLEE